MAGSESARRSGRCVVGINPGDVSAPHAARVMEGRRRTAALYRSTAARALADFGRGSHVFGLTKGQFSMIDVAAVVLGMVGPSDVSVWTWAVADYEVEAVEAFVRSGDIVTFRMVLDYSGAKRHAALMRYMQGRFGLDCLRVTKTHAKVVTIATADDWRVVIRGSMNLNANPRFENFDVSDDAAAYAVVHDVEREIWAKAPALAAARVTNDQAIATLGLGEEEHAAADHTGWMAALQARVWW